MPKITNLEEAPRKELHVFYVLDTSGSMEGTKISALNHAMEECTEALATLAKSNGDAKLKIAVMEFNSQVRWVTSNGPENMEDFEWEYLKCGGLTEVGAALKELDKKLSRHEYLKSMTGALMPVIIFMTDGWATNEICAYEDALEQIRQNKWFKRGTKIGFALGDDADIKMISEVVGNSEAVIRTTDLELFKRLMKFVTVTASMLVSQSHTTETAVGGEAIIKDAKKELGLSDDITPDLEDYEYDKEPDDTADSANDAWEDDDEW